MRRETLETRGMYCWVVVVLGVVGIVKVVIGLVVTAEILHVD